MDEFVPFFCGVNILDRNNKFLVNGSSLGFFFVRVFCRSIQSTVRSVLQRPHSTVRRPDSGDS